MPQRILQTVKKAGYQTGLLLLLVGSSAQAGDILVTVDGIQAAGTVHAALVSGELKRWPEQPLRQQQSDDGQLRLIDLAPGRYAIQLYQDSNGNGQLDQGRRGIPLEPVGFSANPQLLNGKPAPRDSQFEHSTADTQLHIRLQSPKAKK
ncbi:MAG: DUF2141 domain-containing protein [Gammaproteobacteria bacterium]|nr:DUF2141 domain-containing protein [Gammaproteobacteria bacterium]MBU2255282.1 DUF2141 domain-containing protein [Gammaproteobacteria bacterium]MBU2294415.1 DUF2141 domain-containing protein [Gammaproteobacteria bacterium]